MLMSISFYIFGDTSTKFFIVYVKDYVVYNFTI